MNLFDAFHDELEKIASWQSTLSRASRVKAHPFTRFTKTTLSDKPVSVGIRPNLPRINKRRAKRVEGMLAGGQKISPADQSFISGWRAGKFNR